MAACFAWLIAAQDAIPLTMSAVDHPDPSAASGRTSPNDALPGPPSPVTVPSTLIFKPTDYFQRLDLAQVFPSPLPLEVELGAGDGSFLVQYAQSRPDCNFLGVERLLGRLRKIDRKGRRAGLLNLRVIRIEAGYFLEYLLPPTSTRALHVYFPDPWPKRKHRRKRLINEGFPQLARRALQPGGAVHLRTDDADYFAQMTSVLGADAHFEEMEVPPGLASLVTDFERDFHARGVRTLAVSYKLLV
jgi:tRNA (guanine-N7-)-methyltransferase